MTQLLWSLNMNDPITVDPLDTWKRYQAQSKANLRDLPSLEEAEKILAVHGTPPLLSWSERTAARIRRALRAGRREDKEMQP